MKSTSKRSTFNFQYLQHRLMNQRDVRIVEHRLPIDTLIPMKVFLTGAAGFVGSRSEQGVAGARRHRHRFDNLNDYYDVRLKEKHLRIFAITNTSPSSKETYATANFCAS